MAQPVGGDGFSKTVVLLKKEVSTALENPGETMIFVSGRTHNRSRSPR